MAACEVVPPLSPTIPSTPARRICNSCKGPTSPTTPIAPIAAPCSGTSSRNPSNHRPDALQPPRHRPLRRAALLFDQAPRLLRELGAAQDQAVEVDELI